MMKSGPECYQCCGTGKLQHGGVTSECWFCDGQGRVESFAEWAIRKNPATLGDDGAGDTRESRARDCR